MIDDSSNDYLDKQMRTALHPMPPPENTSLSESQVSWSDEQILVALRSGDRQVAGVLYDHLRPTVDRALRRVLRSRYRDFDDLIQMTFERILRALAENRFEGRSSLRTWASAIASHVALDAIRSRVRENQRYNRSPSVSELLAPGRAESRMEALAELQRIHDILSRMNPDLAETLLLHDVLGHPLEEIATLKKAGLSATQSRLRRARIELKRRAAAYLPKKGL